MNSSQPQKKRRAMISPLARHWRSVGLTLLEVLVVALLLGLSCTIGATAVARALRHDPIVDFHQRLPNHWSQIRAWASASGGGELELTGQTLRFRAPLGIRQELPLPRDLALLWYADDGKTPLRSLYFDGQGLSRDASIRIAYRSSTASARIAGLTGAIGPLTY